MNNKDIGSRIQIKPSTFLNPVPVVMVTCGDMEHANIITLAWVGTVNSEPPMISISVRKERFSHDIIRSSGVFGVNLVSEDIVKQCDYCGVRSGRDTDKFAETHLTKFKGEKVNVPLIAESPVCIECKVADISELGSHDMFIGSVENVSVSDKLFDQKGAIDLSRAGLVAYNHGEYYVLGDRVGFFGFSVAGRDALNRRMKK